MFLLFSIIDWTGGGEPVRAQPYADASREVHGGHGAGASMEAEVLVPLPVPAGYWALQAGSQPGSIWCWFLLCTGYIFMPEYVMAVLH